MEAGILIVFGLPIADGSQPQALGNVGDVVFLCRFHRWTTGLKRRCGNGQKLLGLKCTCVLVPAWPESKVRIDDARG